MSDFNLAELESGIEGNISNITVHSNGKVSYLHKQEGNSFFVWKGIKQSVHQDILPFDVFCTDNFFSYVIVENNLKAIVINGEVSKFYKKVQGHHFYDDKKLKYTENFWYVVTDPEESFIIFNGKKLKSYYRINERYIQFIEEKNALRYRAKRKVRDGLFSFKRQWAFIEDEKEGIWCDSKKILKYRIDVEYVGDTLVYFRGSDNVYYPNHVNIAIDKKNKCIYKNIWQFHKSEDEKSYVFVLYSEEGVGVKQTQVVNNGKISGIFDRIGDVIYDPRTNFLVYVGEKSGKYHLIVGDQEIGIFDDISGLRYDYLKKNNYALKVKMGNKRHILFNGVVSKESYEEISDHMIEFGSGKEDFYFIINKKDKYYVVYKNEIYKKGYDEIKGTHVIRCNKGEYSFWAKNGDKYLYVKDGKEFQEKELSLYEYLLDGSRKSKIPESLGEVRLVIQNKPFFTIVAIVVGGVKYNFDKIDHISNSEDFKYITWVGIKGELSSIHTLSMNT